MPKEKKVYPKDSREIAEKNYQLENEENTDYDKGLATTHKLITDHYFEGTIDQRNK